MSYNPTINKLVCDIRNGDWISFFMSIVGRVVSRSVGIDMLIPRSQHYFNNMCVNIYTKPLHRRFPLTVGLLTVYG